MTLKSKRRLAMEKRYVSSKLGKVLDKSAPVEFRVPQPTAAAPAPRWVAHTSSSLASTRETFGLGSVSDHRPVPPPPRSVVAASKSSAAVFVGARTGRSRVVRHQSGAGSSETGPGGRRVTFAPNQGWTHATSGKSSQQPERGALFKVSRNRGSKESTGSVRAPLVALPARRRGMHP